MEKTLSYFLYSLFALAVPFVTTSSAMDNLGNNSITHDVIALLAFKATVFDPQNILLINWTTSKSVCNWIGISCNNIRDQRVAALDLPDMGLVGTIPPQLGNLSFLVRLNLTNNNLHGSLPMELAHLRRLKYISLALNNFDVGFPLWLGALSELQYLSLHSNRFSGPLPIGISNATKLEVLDLAFDFFTGNVPEELSALKNLKALEIGQNKLGGILSPSLFNFSSLKLFSFTNNSIFGNLPSHICKYMPLLDELLLSDNELQGEIPSKIGNCSILQKLSLSYNQLSGKIPREIWNLTSLTALALGGNDLKGEIPEDVGNLFKLEQLGIEDANLTGVIPQGIAELYKLEILYLSSNRLRGPIPLQIFNISTLTVISLTNNQLSGSLPSTLGLMIPNLEELYLGANYLSGKVLTSISNASRLHYLELSSNKFSGSIPHNLGDLRFLEALSLGANNFSYKSPSGELSFFDSLANCKYLNLLWIHDNPLNGYLPNSVGNLSSSVQSIDLSSCGIRREITSSVGNLSNLVDLNLVDNSFEGIIPNTIRHLLKLQRINFGENNLQGHIPSEFCFLSTLGQLSLDGNILSGKVPNCISNMTSLRYLYLGSNHLNSTIPSSLWSLIDILELDLSTNFLMGSLPILLGNLKASTKLNLSMNQLFGEIPSTIGGLQNLQFLSLAHNRLTGSIPESMKTMLSLLDLDLSVNSLDGAIPNSLEKLSSLHHFNVSCNKLSGPIPHGGPFMKFKNLSFLSNEGLCGEPLLQPCKKFEHKSRKKIGIFVLLAIGVVVLALTISFLLIKKLRRRTTAQTPELYPEISYERVSYHEIRQMTNGFNDNNLVGSGTFGSVYKGIRANGLIWAIKVFDLNLDSAFKSFDTECEVLRQLRHRNLTKVISTCSNPDFRALILEYMPNGSLEKRLYLEDSYLNIMQRLDIMMDVASGLDYLHHGYSVPVVHCDLKPSNILLDQDMVGHVSDFGITKMLGDEENVVHTETLATFGYIAPEYGLKGIVSTKCDVYSFGITLMETFTRKRPRDEMFSGELNIRQWVQESLPDSIIQIVDANLFHPENGLATKERVCISSILQLALSCTVDAPVERINMKDALLGLEKIKFQFSKSPSA